MSKYEFTYSATEPFTNFEICLSYRRSKEFDGRAMTHEDRVAAFKNYEAEYGEQSYYVENEFDENGQPNEDYDPYLWIRPKGEEPDENWREITFDEAVAMTDSGFENYKVYVIRTITKECIAEAVKKFCVNPYWKDVLDNAPSGAKQYLKLLFVNSTIDLSSDEDSEEYLDRMKRLLKCLKPADWQYLIDTAGPGSAAGLAKKKYRELLAIAKDRELLKRDKQTAPRLMKELRKAYRDWDAGRITDKQYLDEAHRIEDIESRLEAAGMVSESASSRFHDLYYENILAVNDIFDM